MFKPSAEKVTKSVIASVDQNFAGGGCPWVLAKKPCWLDNGGDKLPKVFNFLGVDRKNASYLSTGRCFLIQQDASAIAQKGTSPLT